MSLLELLNEKGRVEGRAIGYAIGYAEGFAEGFAQGRVEAVMDFMCDGVYTPAKARAQLIALRQKYPECKQFADQALAEIGDRE